ncbi:MAG: hypothetical protein KIT36_02225 [Alphaproteobacteria bacterium]|nr:hypothetical protein [Alphaproteobacteria bacterium]
MPPGFALLARRGHVRLQLYGTPSPGRLPLIRWHEDGGQIAVIMGRLYYRPDLIQSLNLSTDAPEARDDAALALTCYRRHGRDGLARLEGDFAVVVLDPGQRHAIALRDPMGGYPVYWLASPQAVAIASSLHPLLDCLDDTTPDIGFLGELLTLPFAEIDYYQGTALNGVQRLVPGSTLRLDLARPSAEVRPFWSWPDKIIDPGSDRLEVVAERYGAALRRAVDERLQGTVAAQMSGGMDSTAVALLALDTLGRSGRPLHALSLTYEKLGELGHETPYLESVLDRPGLLPHRIAADDILDFDLFGATPLHDEPYCGLFRAGLDIALTAAAADHGVDTMLTGFGADEMLAAAPFYIADLCRNGRVLAAWREASRWAAAQRCSIWRILRPFAVTPLLPVSLEAGLGPWLRGGYAEGAGENSWTLPSWVLPDFARRGRLRQRLLGHLRRTYRSSRSVVLSEALARIAYTSGDWARTTLAAPHGVLIAHPFRDPRVLALGLGTRLRLRPEPGQQKPVLARAMRDVLPRSILERRSKGHFNALYYAGLTRNLARLEALVRDSPVDTLGLFDKDGLVRDMRRKALGIDGMDRVIRLNNALAIVQWLAQWRTWRAQQLAPGHVIDCPMDA